MYKQGMEAQGLNGTPLLRRDRMNSLGRCSPRVPFDTGMLEKSGKLGTVIGSGEVDYAAPYAAAQYYNTSESRSYDPNRGGQWFERMKASEKEEILEGAEKVE